MKSYYIENKLVLSDAIDSEPDIKIWCVETDVLYQFGGLEGPYYSIEQLKKNSSLFQDPKRTNMRKVQKVLYKKNILEAKIGIISDKNKTVTGDFIKLVDHSIRGNVKSKKIFGVHHFDECRMMIKEMINTEDKNLIWEAIVEVSDKEKNISYEKQSTFFPRKWSLTQLFHECDYAFLHKVKIDGKDSLYQSFTISGIPVHIIIYDGKAKSIYPLYTK